MSIEISAGGLSLATDETLQVGDEVELDSVFDSKASAVVRHKQGRIHGVEFVRLAPEHAERIREACRKLQRFYVKGLDI